jgi:ABC-2 type transport system permease protein
VSDISVRADLRALLAAGLKPWRTSRRYPTNLIGLVVWPIILPLAFVLQADGLAGGSEAAASAFAARTGTAEVASFLFLGWAVYMWLSIILWGPGTALRTEQIRGSLEAQLLSPASRVVILFGPVVEGMVWVLMVFAVVLLTLTLGFGLSIGPLQVAGALGVVVIGLPALYGLGAAFFGGQVALAVIGTLPVLAVVSIGLVGVAYLVAAVVLRLKEPNLIVDATDFLFAVLSGVAFSVVVLPDPVRVAAFALPTTYALDLMRVQALGTIPLVSAPVAWFALAGVSAGWLVIGRWAFQRTDHAMRVRGTIGGH